MTVNDFKEVKNSIMIMFNNQKDSLNDYETKAYQKEIYKLDSFIDIYQHDDIKYKVMRLERLYMQNIMGITEEEFSKLPLEEKSDFFIKVFPEKWVTDVDINDKLNYLENSILENKIIHIKDDSLDDDTGFRK